VLSAIHYAALFGNYALISVLGGRSRGLENPVNIGLAVRHGYAAGKQRRTTFEYPLKGLL